MGQSVIGKDAAAVDSTLSTWVMLFLQMLRMLHLHSIISSCALGVEKVWDEWHLW